VLPKKWDQLGRKGRWEISDKIGGSEKEAKVWNRCISNAKKEPGGNEPLTGRSFKQNAPKVNFHAFRTTAT